MAHMRQGGKATTSHAQSSVTLERSATARAAGSCYGATPSVTRGKKAKVLPPGSLFALPGRAIVHHTWTKNEEVEVQANFVGPANITFIDPARRSAQEKTQ